MYFATTAVSNFLPSIIQSLPTSVDDSRIYFQGMYTGVEKTSEKDSIALDMTKFQGTALSISICFYKTRNTISYKSLSPLNTYEIVDNQVVFPLELEEYGPVEHDVLKFHGFIDLEKSETVFKENTPTAQLAYTNSEADTVTNVDFPVVVLPQLRPAGEPESYELALRASRAQDSMSSFTLDFVMAGIPMPEWNKHIFIQAAGHHGFVYLKTHGLSCKVNGVDISFKIHNSYTLVLDMSRSYTNPHTPLVLECPATWLFRVFPAEFKDDSDDIFTKILAVSFTTGRLDSDEFEYHSTTFIQAQYRFGDYLRPSLTNVDTFPIIRGQAWVENQRVGCAFQLNNLFKNSFQHTYEVQIYGPPIKTTSFRLFSRHNNMYASKTFERRTIAPVDRTYYDDASMFVSSYEKLPFQYSFDKPKEDDPAFILLHVADIDLDVPESYNATQTLCLLRFSRIYTTHSSSHQELEVIGAPYLETSNNQVHDHLPDERFGADDVIWPAHFIPPNLHTPMLNHFKFVIHKVLPHHQIKSRLQPLTLPQYTFRLEIGWDHNITPDEIRIISPSLDLKFIGLYTTCKWNGSEDADVLFISSESDIAIKIPETPVEKGPHIFRCRKFFITPVDGFPVTERFILRVSSVSNQFDLQSGVVTMSLDEASDDDQPYDDDSDDRRDSRKSFVGWNVVFVSVLSVSLLAVAVLVTLFVVLLKKYQRTKRNESFYRTLLASEQVGSAEFSADYHVNELESDHYQQLH